MTDDFARIVLDNEDWENDLPETSDMPVIWRRMPTTFAQPFAAHEIAPDGLVGDQYFD